VDCSQVARDPGSSKAGWFWGLGARAPRRNTGSVSSRRVRETRAQKAFLNIVSKNGASFLKSESVSFNQSTLYFPEWTCQPDGSSVAVD
jgi:hypothetical protein